MAIECPPSPSLLSWSMSHVHWTTIPLVRHGSLYPMTLLSALHPMTSSSFLSASTMFYMTSLLPLLIVVLVGYDIIVCTILMSSRLMWPLAKCISSSSMQTPSLQLGVLQSSLVEFPLLLPFGEMPHQSDPPSVLSASLSLH